jgi:hypothetical protein
MAVLDAWLVGNKGITRHKPRMKEDSSPHRRRGYRVSGLLVRGECYCTSDGK